MIYSTPAAREMSTMQRYRPQLAFLFLLVLWYGTFDWVYRQVPDQLLADRVYRWGINEVAADIINALHSDARVSVDAHRLVSPRATLEVVRGCDGSGLLFLLSAAVLAFSASWRRKLVGLAAATAAVYVLNELRIVALYFVLVSHPAWFVALHASVIPMIVIAFNAMFYLWWTHWATTHNADVAG